MKEDSFQEGPLETNEPAHNVREETSTFFIVGIGASAGGLDALERFFKHMPADSGMGFVIIQHLSPEHKSLMAELLGKITEMPVKEAEEGWMVKPNMVYLIPSKKILRIKDQRLRLENRGTREKLQMPIDIFFKSLAEDRKEKAIGVILSGNGSDGTLGLTAIKKANGRAYVQDLESSQFTGMPRNAIGTQLVDYVSIPEDLPKAIIQGFKRESAQGRQSLAEELPVSKILRLLVEQTGVDFSWYKQKTIVRRIEHRMQTMQFATVDDYANVMTHSPDEIDLLFKELLIGVTNFFRDEEAFTQLKEKAIYPMIANARPHQSIRVWIPGCSTGEEAYSIAMIFREAMLHTGQQVAVKIFATDINQDAIDFAGRGQYTKSDLASVSDERKAAFFIQRGEYYEVKRYLREMIVFAKQNLLNDPPFSRIDLISCRNLLIYFDAPYQTKAFSIFRFALNKKGILFLGSSEKLDKRKGFYSLNTKWQLYEYQFNNKRFTSPVRGDVASIDGNRFVHQYEPDEGTVSKQWSKVEADNLLYKDLLEKINTTAVLVDENRIIQHAFGELYTFFKLPTGGRIEFDIVSMARQEISVLLSTIVHKVFQQETKIVYRDVFVEIDNKGLLFDLKAMPINGKASKEKFVYLTFEKKESDDSRPATTSNGKLWNDSVGERIHQLERELKYTKENLQATIEELETSNEELQATNEEMLASNEELQSTNEELQSVNEELLTVNAEYQTKIHELTELNNDISNLFNSTEVGTIFLDERLNIRKFTQFARKEINLINQDVGRPLSHISHNLLDIDLVVEATAVLNTLIVREKEVQNEQGVWFMLKIIPYRTTENVIKGVVITLIDISLLKTAQKDLADLAEETKQNELKFHQALQFSRIAIFHQDEDLRYSWVYNPFPKFPGYEDKSTVGKFDDDLFLPDDVKILTDIKQAVLATGMGSRQIVELTIQNEQVSYDLFVEPLESDKGNIVGVACVSIDVTEREFI